MTLDDFSETTQKALRRWAQETFGSAMLVEHVGCEVWAWIYWLLRATQDRPEWFPKGKWATVQILEQWLEEEAKTFLDGLGG